MPMMEFDIISRYFAPRARVTDIVQVPGGDDAAVLKIPVGKRLAVSADTVHVGVDFPSSAVLKT